MRIFFFFLLTLFSFGETSLVKKKSEIYGLLIAKTGNGGYAGMAAKMNATVIPTTEGTPFAVNFNQATGKMMSAATQEVYKYTSKDEPSATVACTLMVDSLFLGQDIDPKVAVTGDMTATGDVRPVGCIESKIRGGY